MYWMFTNERLEMTDQAGKKNLLLTVRAVDGNSVIDEIYVYLSFQRSEATFLSEFTQYNSSIERDRLK